jgi:FkbM family methyltransferase
VTAVAVEAVPDNVVALRKNVGLNGLGDAISIVPYALGATAGVAQIQVEGDLEAGEGTGTANILADGTTFECVRQEVRVRTLDELLDSGELPRRCSVVKIDTDGYDLKVLQGGTKFLARDRPVVFGEFSAHCLNWHGQSLSDVVAFADANGYQTWRRQIPEWRFTRTLGAGTFEQDLLLVPRERVDAFARLLAS